MVVPPKVPAYVQQAQQQRTRDEERSNWMKGRKRFQQNKVMFDNGIKQRNTYLDPRTSKLLPSADTCLPDQGEKNPERFTESPFEDETVKNNANDDNDSVVSKSSPEETVSVLATSGTNGGKHRGVSRSNEKFESEKQKEVIQGAIDALEMRKKELKNFIAKYDANFIMDLASVNALDEFQVAIDCIENIETAAFNKAIFDSGNANEDELRSIVQDHCKILGLIYACQETVRQMKSAFVAQKEDVDEAREMRNILMLGVEDIITWLKAHKKELDVSIGVLKTQL